MLRQLKDDVYRYQIRGVSQSQIKRLLDISPKEFIEEIRIEETPAMLKGTMVHSVALEGIEIIHDHFAIDDYISKTGKKRSNSREYQAFKKELEHDARINNKTYIKQEDLESTRQMIKAVSDAWGKDSKQPLLAVEGLPEVCLYQLKIFGEHLGKGKIDFLPNTKPFIADLKTTANGLDDRSIKKKLLYDGWLLQAAYYHDLFQIETGESRTFVFLVVGKNYQTRTVKIPPRSDAMSYGREQYLKGFQIYADCVEKNEWLGYETYDASNLFIS